MLYNCVVNTLDRFNYVNPDEYFIESLDENNKTINKTLVYENTKIGDKIFNIGTCDSNAIAFPFIEFTNFNISQIVKLCKTYSPNIIYIPQKIMVNMVRNGLFNRSNLNNETNFGVFINDIKELKSLIEELAKIKMVNKSITDIVMFDTTDCSVELKSCLIKMIRYSIKTLISYKGKKDVMKSIEKDNSLFKLFINKQERISEDLSTKGITLDGNNAGIYTVKDIKDDSKSMTNWGKIYINTSTPYFGDKPKIDDGGKYSTKNNYYRVIAGETKHPTLDKSQDMKILFTIINTEMINRKIK